MVAYLDYSAFHEFEEKAQVVRARYSNLVSKIRRGSVPVELIAERLFNLRISFEDLSGLLDENAVRDKYTLLGVLIPRESLMVIDECSEVAVQRFTVAHELGHWVLHAKEGREIKRQKIACGTRATQRNRVIERQANRFAASLLIPSQWVGEIIEERGWVALNLDSVSQLAEYFEVSIEAMGLKLEELVNLGYLNVRLNWKREVPVSSVNMRQYHQHF